MTRVLIAVILVAALGAQPFAKAQTAAKPKPASHQMTGPAQIVQLIQSQQAAWNRHDLDGFMAGYWNSPELTFFSGGTVNHGWQAARDRYVKRYQSEGRSMGQLEFRELHVEMLGPASAFVRGEFHLTMPDKSTPHGIFTLVFRKFPRTGATSGWKIIHDHSSTE